MAALIPVTQPPNVEAAYEDMFKEITRKLYGEETGNGLHTLGTPVAHIATSGPTAPEGERSFTTLMSDRSLATTIEYDQNGSTETSTVNNFKTEDHLTTAFGLAALMQNGFATTGTILNTQALSKPNTNITTAATTSSSNTINVVANSSTASIAANTDQRWTTTADEILTWPTASETKLTAFNGSSQKAVKSIKNRDHTDTYHATNSTNTVVIQTNNAQPSNSNRKNKNANSNQIAASNNSQIQIQKRYSCGHCPYSTDRRDLYTRHENIHKDEKPFQCYACLKQFNRADHVKKHFLRMHRELAYDINKTRRSIVPEQKPIIFVQQNTNNNQQTQSQSQPQQQQISQNFINSQRPTTLQDTSLSIAQTIESVATAQIAQHPQMKQEKTGDEKSPVKIKREKRFSCCYCPWSGADKWGLKRHLNTHTKPFVCMLCDYKAARSERLATHVLKVHNKKACNKCSFLAENQEEYQAHINEIHPHDQRPSRSNNNNNNNSSNVLRTIGNTLVTSNNQINNFQNPSTSFGTIQTTSTGVAIYTTNDPSGNPNNGNGNIQEIIVNPTTMVGWRLSATGSLIPPSHITHTGNEQSAVGGGAGNTKRGAERLFQYLEADGSDPEDYTRQLKMDAISRNTASVAQDFHNAGGVVQNLKYVSNKKNNYEDENFIKNEFFKNSPMLNDKKNITSIQKTVLNSMKIYEKKERNAMTIFYNKNESKEHQQHMKSPPAYHTNSNKINSSPLKSNRNNYLTQQDKENSNSIFTNMEYDCYSPSTQFQNYVKEIINKYYAETPLLCTEPDIKPDIYYNNNNNNKMGENLKDETKNYTNKFKEIVSNEARDYFEYLSRKKDITITYGNGQAIKQYTDMIIAMNEEHSISNIPDKRKRKQSQPKKITKPDIMTILRDKYLKRLVDPRKSCIKCTNTSYKHNMLVFPYHTAGSLALHRVWRHSPTVEKCKLCNKKFLRNYSQKIHMLIKHRRK